MKPKKGEMDVDEMKIALRTKMMRGIIAKIAAKVIKKKLGISSDIQLHEITIEKIGDKIHLHLNVDADISENDILQITRLANMEEDE